MSDWKPNLYLTFEKERTQPSIDLVTRINIELPRRIIDIGCGPGNSTNILRSRWGDAEIIGLDNSMTMIEQAKSKYKDMNWMLGDASNDISDLGLFDIVFSNAAIQWMPNHQLLLSNLYNALNTGGVLAVQVPCTKDMPMHTELIKLISTPKWESQFSSITSTYSMFTADFYYDILSDLTEDFDLWETDYYHVMNNHQDIVKWYSGSGLRPYLDCITDENVKAEFLTDYEDVLKNAYPLQRDTKVIFPFTRIFFTAQK